MIKLTPNPEFISLLYELTQINSSFIIIPTEDKITVTRCNDVMAFKIEAPLEYFNIQEPIAIFNFRDFYSFYKSQKDYDIFIDVETNEIIFKNCNSELPFPLSDPEFIINDNVPTRFEVSENECDFVFTLNSEDIHNLSSKCSQIKPDVGTNSKLLCNVTYNDGKSEIILKAESYKPSFKLYTNVDKIYNNTYESQSYTILPSIFQCLPKSKDFLVMDIFEKVLIFKMIDPNISLNIITWKIYE